MANEIYDNEIESLLNGVNDTASYGLMDEAAPSVVVGGTVGGRGQSVAGGSSYEKQGHDIIRSFDHDKLVEREELAKKTKWIKTVLEKEPIKDEEGNIVDEDKIPKKAIGFRVEVDGVEKLMTKDMLQSFVATKAAGVLGDKEAGEPCLQLSVRYARAPKGDGTGSVKPPIFSFRALGKEHTLTKHYEQWDCVEFAKEPVIENGTYKRKPVPATPKEGKDDPTFTPKDYIVYKWKEEYSIFDNKTRSGGAADKKTKSAFAVLLAYTASTGVSIF